MEKSLPRKDAKIAIEMHKKQQKKQKGWKIKKI